MRTVYSICGGRRTAYVPRATGRATVASRPAVAHPSAFASALASSSPLAAASARRPFGVAPRAFAGAVDRESVPPPAFRAALDLKAVRDDPDLYKRNAAERNADCDVDLVVRLFEESQALQVELDAARADRNANAAGMKGRLEPDARAALIEAGREIKERVQALEARASALDNLLQREGQRLPNLTHPDVPRSSDEADATLVRTVGRRRDFAAEGFAPRDHVALGDALGILDFAAGSRVTGPKARGGGGRERE